MLRDRTAIVLLFALGLCSWTASAVMLWSAAVLGHDEARYAISASDWLAGHPARWSYVPYAMNLIGAPGIVAGGSERALRVVPIVLGIGFLVAAAHLARQVASPRTAAWLVATLGATASLAKRSAELLSDLPAALCLLAAIALLVAEIDRDRGPRWRVVWAAPLLATAFYVRYGTCIPIAMIGLAVAAIGARAIAARPAPAIATFALLGLLLVPHFVLAHRLTGSPLGIVFESADVIGAGFATSLITYTTSNPFGYYGLTAPVLIGGVLSVAVVRDRRRALLWTIAVLDVLALGLMPLPAVRYIVVAIVLFALLGIDAIARAIASRSPRTRAWFGALAVAAIGAAAVQTGITAYRLASTARTRMASTVLAAEAIRRDAAGARCEVIGRHTTQLQWYSGCDQVFVATADAIRRARAYVVIEPHGVRQPSLHDVHGANLAPALTAIFVDRNVTVTRVGP